MDIQEFKNFLVHKNAKIRTIENYLYYVKKLQEQVNINDIDNTFISNYFIKLREKYSPNTTNIIRATFVQLKEFLGKDWKIPIQAKIQLRNPDFITEEYFVNNVLPAVDIHCNTDHIKKKTILMLMFYAGLRNREVVGLKRTNFNLDEKYLDIKDTKTSVDRRVPLIKEVIEYLKIYFSVEVEGKSAFNIGFQGVSHIFQQLKPYFKSVKFCPKLLRASCATYWLSKGLDLKSVQNLLGHARLTTTERYLGSVNWKDMGNRMEEIRNFKPKKK